MYSKIRKTAIALCFFLGICTINYAANPITQATKLTQKRFACQLGGGSKTITQQHYSYNAYVGIPLSKNKWQSQGSYPIVPHAKRLYTNISSPVYSWGLLSTAHTKNSGRTHMHLKYKLGISACIASIIATQLYLNRVEATGHRGNGYRPYDCRWRKEFKRQAEKALEDADLFKRLYRTGKLSKKNTDALGTSVLVALLWAQDQGEHLITKHYGNYFCSLMRSAACDYYTNNLRARNQYYGKLTREINTIRDLLDVPHPVGWEDQVGHFLYGGAKAAGLVVSAETIIAAVPGLNVVALGAGAVYGVYKGIEWIDKNVIDPGKGLDEEEEYIKQELFVRALCADEHSIKQAQGWGSFVVSTVLITDGVIDGLGKLLGDAELFEVLEALEITEALEDSGNELIVEEIKKQLNLEEGNTSEEKNNSWFF